ncbi:4-hydroxythreonine-4-phosphate dehydrogenase PdxA [Methylobacillus methanolivorans]|uniref:4-hydroxythreonine-4-phosphate dehydrogenase n=1 Tax=Methylobacillus methanolivorans TaxID=1848927 RepID=A0ABW8GPT7_9PROT
MQTLPRIVITAGEPAGIGIDLCVMLAGQALPCHLVVIADQDVLESRAQALQLPLQIQRYVPENWPSHLGQHQLTVLHQPCPAEVIAGQLDTRNGAYVLQTLERAINGCMQGEFDAMVTAPVHKGVINDAGVAFTGHTEFLAEHTHTPQVVMMLVGGELRVALATTHLPLAEVSQAITQDSLETTIRILHHDLINKFGIRSPRILVTGLNPHAGEGGHLGMEEITTITPVLEKLRAEGMLLKGPLPADTLFTQHNLAQGDCVLAMYHDQGLPVLKHASFGEGVNVTLGLPMIRTSVDHGTALDLAGKGNIEIGSLLSAIQLAITLATHSKQSS